MEALHAELAGAKLGELRRRAKAAGVPPADIETVIDEADDPKAAVVELIVAAEALEELAGMKLGALRKRAKALGVDPAALEEAIDEADDPRAVVVEMIKAASAGIPEGVPGVAKAEPEQELALVAAAAAGPLNEPGHWDAMISYTQRNPAAELLAEGLYSSMRERGKTVWLDVKMRKLNEAAMKEAVQNSRCVLAIITGPCVRADPAEGEQPEENAYFKREYCANELRWAREAGVPIQPVILADDKKHIGDLLKLAPEDLKDLGSVDFIHLDRSRPSFWKAGIDDILSNVADLSPDQESEPEPEPEGPHPGPEPEPDPGSLQQTRSVPHPEPEPEYEPVDDAHPFRSCIDRPYVKKEIGWARKYGKKIIVVFEKENHRPGFFDYAKAAEKYNGTEFEFILGIDAIPYQRDTFLADAMLQNIFAKAVGAADIEPPSSPINDPGEWEFFLSHHQARGGDQVQTLSLRFEKKGKKTWYDNAMLDKSESAMEEGVKQSKYFVLFLSAEEASSPATPQPTPTRAEPQSPSQQAGGIDVFVAHDASSTDLAGSLCADLPGATAGLMDSIPGDTRVLVFLLNDEVFAQIRNEGNDIRQALADAFESETQVVIPVVDENFDINHLDGLPDDIRSLARQRLVPMNWEDLASGVESVQRCIEAVSESTLTALVEGYLSSVVQQTATFKDPCTQEDLSTETQCVPLKLLTVGELQDSREKTTKTVDASDMLLLKRRAGLGGTIGYGDSHAVGLGQAVHEADVHFAKARQGKTQHRLDEAMMTVAVIVGPAACGKTTLLNRAACGYAKDALRGYPGSLVPLVVRVMAFSRWLIKNSKDTLDEAVFLEYILDTECAGQRKGLYDELFELFQARRLALIFDGLDEAGPKLTDIARYIGKGLGRSYRGRMIVSSRESLLDEAQFEDSRFQMLQIQPLTEAMMEDVLRRRFDDARDIDVFKEQQSGSESLREMGTNPLLLALQIGVFKLDDKQLPDLRTELYEKGVRMLLRRVEVGKKGERSVKALAAAIKTTPPKKRRTKTDDQIKLSMNVLCRMGYLLHVEKKTRDFAVGDIYEMLEQAELGDAASAAWADLVQDGRGILMCVEQDPDGDGDSNSDVLRSTHLTLQEYFAAYQCVNNARESGDVLESLKDVFGLVPSPWLREVLLMVTEMLRPEEFQLLADYYLDADDGSGAANVRVTTMLKCRREDTSSGVGAHIKQRLSKARSVELMVDALCHPNDDLRSSGLTEILEFGMPKDGVVTQLLAKIREEPSAEHPWYLQLGAARSLGKLQICSGEVISCLVEVIDPQSPLLCEEALRAIKTLDAENSDLVVELVLQLLHGSDGEKQFAWTSAIRPLEMSDDRILDALASVFADDDQVTSYVAQLRPSPEPEPEPAEPGLAIGRSVPPLKPASETPGTTQSVEVEAPVASATSVMPEQASAAEDVFTRVTTSEPDTKRAAERLQAELESVAAAVLCQRKLAGDEVEPVIRRMMEVVDDFVPGLMQHGKVLLANETFRQMVADALGQLRDPSDVSGTLLWATQEAATVLVAGTGPSSADAYHCIQQFEDGLRKDSSRDANDVIVMELLGLERSARVERLVERLGSVESRHFAYAPLLHHVRAVDAGGLPEAVTGKESEALRETLGEQLTKISGVEALFLRKELQVGKFEVDLPSWAGALDVQKVEREDESQPEPEPEPESAPQQATMKLPSLGKGDHAKTEKGAFGILTMDPDKDNDVKMRTADGATSGYIKGDTLTEASAEEYEAELARWAGLRERFKKGAHAKTVAGQLGVVVEDAKAEGSDASKVRLRMADGKTSDRISVAELAEASAEEVAAYEAEVTHYAVLRERFKKGAHATTAKSQIGVVVADAKAEGSYANKVQLRMVDGKASDHVSVTELTAASVNAAAVFDAEFGRRFAKHLAFHKGVYAKVADGRVGVVVDDAATEGYRADQVQLRLADGSTTDHVALDALTALDGVKMQVAFEDDSAAAHRYGFGPVAPLTYSGDVVATEPRSADATLTNAAQLRGKVALAHRGQCSFADKATRMAEAGALVAIVVNDAPGKVLKPGDPKSAYEGGIPLIGVSKEVGAKLMAGGKTPGGYVKIAIEVGSEVAEYEAEVTRWAGLRERFTKGTHVTTAAGVVGVVVFDAASEGYQASKVSLRLADGSTSDSINVDKLTESSSEELADYEAEVTRWVVLRERFTKGTHATTAAGVVGVVKETATAEGDFANTVKLQAADGSYLSKDGAASTVDSYNYEGEAVRLDSLSEPSAEALAAYKARAARFPSLQKRFGKGSHAKIGTLSGIVGVIDDDASDESYRGCKYFEGSKANVVKLRLADGTCSEQFVDKLTDPSIEELQRYKAEVARWVKLRERFKKGVHAKTAKGQVGLVVEDARAEGFHASKVRLRLANGSEPPIVQVDTLAEASAEEVAEYEAEVARWAGLRERFKKSTHAKTAEGLLGEVIEDATHHVQLRLADGSMTNWIKIDQLDLATEHHEEATRRAALREQFNKGEPEPEPEFEPEEPEPEPEPEPELKLDLKPEPEPEPEPEPNDIASSVLQTATMQSLMEVDSRERVIEYLSHVEVGAVSGSKWSQYFDSPRQEVEAAADILLQDGAAFNTTLPGSHRSASQAHGRAPTIAWVIAFTKENDCWAWPTSRVVDEIMIPRTAATHCRFAELPECAAQFGPADSFVAHCWAAQWGTMVAALAEFPDHSHRVWIDCFAVRQWPGNRSDLAFKGVIERCSSFILAVQRCDLSQIDDCHDISSRRMDLIPADARKTVALFRAECLTELTNAIDANVLIVMKCGELFSAGPSGFEFKAAPSDTHGLLHLFDAAQTEAATAVDQDMFLKMLRARPGGVNAFNRQVHKVIAAALVSASAPEVQAWACGDRSAVALDGASPDDMWRLVYTAAGSGHLELLQQLLHRGLELDAVQTGKFRYSLFVAAACSGHLNCVAALIGYFGDAAAEVINRQNPKSDFALAAAAEFGHADVIEALLNASADANQTNADGKSAIAFAAQGCHIEAMALLMANGATVGVTEAGVSDLHQWVDKSAQPPESRAAARLWIESKRDESHSIAALKDFYSSEADVDKQVRDATAAALAKWRESGERPMAEVYAVVDRMRQLAPYSDARRVAMNTFIRTIGEPSALADWLEIISADPEDKARLCDYARHSHYGHFQFVLLRVSAEPSAPSAEQAQRAADSLAAYPDWFSHAWVLELSVWQPSFTDPAAVFESKGALKPNQLREPPHTHPYEFFSKVVTGDMRHNRYVQTDAATPGQAYSDVEFNKTHEAWPPHKVSGKCRLKATEEDVEFSAGESYRMPLGVIHDVEFDATSASTPAITCVIAAEQEVAPDVYMEDSMLSHHDGDPGLATRDSPMPLDTWRANMRAIAGYLRQETDALTLQAGTEEVKDTFLMRGSSAALAPQPEPEREPEVDDV
eukprot:COSAG04_NODE_388_length_15249_cov_7.616502_4_plen_3423_part_00